MCIRDRESAKEIIIVEGRADVISLLRSGIQNVIALEGAKVPQTIINICKEKEATAFLDGDRGGDLILKELLQVTNVKYIARAPEGKEVEDLTSKEIMTALQEREPIEKVKAKMMAKKKRGKVLFPRPIVDSIEVLKGTLEAVLFNEKVEQMERLPVSQLAERLQQIQGVDTVVFDGVITQRLVDIAGERGIKHLVAARVSDVIKQPLGVHILTFADVEG